VKEERNPHRKVIISFAIILLTGCATGDSGVRHSRGTYFEPRMDFASLQTVAVLPFRNLSGQDYAAERVRDAFTGWLLATETLYVLPPGEVARGIGLIGRFSPEGPTIDQIKKLAGVLDVDAVITGVVSEYGPIRSGAASSNVVSISLQIIEVESGLVVWSARTTRGGVSFWDRLVGSGGRPMSAVTRRAVNDLLSKLFE
jgi:TolB-like protein